MSSLAVFCVAKVPVKVRSSNNHVIYHSLTTIAQHINKFLKEANAASQRYEYTQPEGYLMYDGHISLELLDGLNGRPAALDFRNGGTVPPVNEDDLENNMFLGWKTSDTIQWVQDYCRRTGLSTQLLVILD